MGRLFSEIVSSFEIPAKKTDLPVDIPVQDCVSVRSRELTMNADGSCAGNRGYLSGPFAARLKASNVAVENHEIADICSVAVPFAIDMLKLSVFLNLTNKVFVERDLKFRRQLDFVRLNHLDLDR